MGAYRIKKLFAGKAVVMAAEDEQVFGPDTLAECRAWIANREEASPVAAPSPDAPPGMTLAEEDARVRVWDRKVAEFDRTRITAEEAELRPVLLVRRSQAEVDFLLREDGPIKLALKQGLEGGRRERIRYLRPPKAA